MPHPSRGHSRRELESSNIQLAYAVRYYESDEGFAVCDLRNPDNGLIEDGCKVAGTCDAAINAPSEVWDNKIDKKKHPLVLIAILPDGQGPPLVMGLAYARMRYAASGQSTEQSDGATVRDKVIENGGTRVVVKEDGRTYITAVANVIVTLSNGATMQVTDEDTSENAALAGPAFENDDALASAVNKIERWLASLTINPSNGAVTAPLPPIPFPGATAFNFLRGKLQSALLRLSSKNKAVV